jgi:hypothetical protein
VFAANFNGIVSVVATLIKLIVSEEHGFDVQFVVYELHASNIFVKSTG